MSPASAASCDAPAALRDASRRKPVKRSMLADRVVENVVFHGCCEIWLPISTLPPDRFEPPLRLSEGRNAPLAARREASALRTFPSAVTIDGCTCRARCTASASVIWSGCVVVSCCWACEAQRHQYHLRSHATVALRWPPPNRPPRDDGRARPRASCTCPVAPA